MQWRLNEDDPEVRAERDRYHQTQPNGHAPDAPVIRATPYIWTDPAQIPRRQFLYGRHLARGYLCATVGPSGYGKSSLISVDALAMVSGRALLGEEPAGQLRVWYINLEDPEDELKRRITAAALHHRISSDDIADRLFVDSGRKAEIVIAKDVRDGLEFAAPVIEALKAEIISNRIDVVQIDPFVASHAVSENDNTKIAAVARQWANLAEATGCAVELVHHARKGQPGQTFVVEDARGASALIAAVRSARVVNIMTKDEAERANVENPAAYFNVANGKANLAPRSDKATWRHIVGVPLNNGAVPNEPGDFVGVVEAWSWPDPFADVSPADAKEVQKRIAQGEWRADHRATNWAGRVIADVLEYDLSNKDSAASVRTLLRGWLTTGALRVVPRRDGQRKERQFIEVGQWFP